MLKPIGEIMFNLVEALKAKVKAVNHCHEEANKLYDVLLPIFEPLLGCQLDKMDGTFLSKIDKLLPNLPPSPRLSVYRSTSEYSLAFTVKACENIADSHGCLYYEITIYIGNMNDRTLTKLTDRPKPLRTDFTEQEILDKRIAWRKARDAFDDARSDLWPFGEETDS